MNERSSSRRQVSQFCFRATACALLLCQFALGSSQAAAPQDRVDHYLQIALQNPKLDLQQQRKNDPARTYLEGTYRVFENRSLASGREIDLHLVILPARSESPQPDPVFALHGGPGAAATTMLQGLTGSWLREERDIVLVDQRGTGQSNPLHIAELQGNPDLQSFLEPMFRAEIFEAAIPELEKRADLTQYTTLIAMDDLNEIRHALGYDKINLRGGSYGSRAVLEYCRRHPESVRTATIQGIAPVSFRNPLEHAQAAQDAIDLIFEECRSEEQYRQAFPDIEKKFAEVLERLEREPAKVKLAIGEGGEETTVLLTRDAFAESLRVVMYRTNTSRQVPRLIMAAHEGNYKDVAIAGINQTAGLRNLLAFGMLMCVIGSEDIPRIDPAEVEEKCAGTFLGSARVRQQMEVAKVWPRGDVPADYGDPVDVDVPVLLFSGTIDPVTPPRFGDEAARHLPNSLHVVVPGAHGVGGPAVQRLEEQFLESASLEGSDTSAIEQMRLPPLELPSASDSIEARDRAAV